MLVSRREINVIAMRLKLRTDARRTGRKTVFPVPIKLGYGRSNFLKAAIIHLEIV